MNQLPWMLLLSVTVLFSAGCESSSTPSPVSKAPVDDHDHDHDHGDAHGHSHPKTLAAGVQELTKLRNTVRDAFAKNDIEAAHGPLHDVGHLLEDITALAEKENLSAESLASVKASVETLFDAFGAVDKTLHDQEGSAYSEVSTKIDDAIQTLNDVVTAITPPAAPAAPQAPKKDAAAENPAAATDETPAAEEPPETN